MLTLRPDLAAALTAAAAGVGDAPPPPSDVLTLRAVTNLSLDAMMDRFPATPDVTATLCSAVSADGAAVPLRWYARADARRGAAIVYAHGGGMICGSASQYDPLVRHYVQRTGIPFCSVDYRLAPEHRASGLGQDVLAALRWLQAEAPALGVDLARVAVMGDSGGGGVAAATAIMARDAGMKLARQILIYPMLDDRNVRADPTIEPFALWSYAFNRIAWAAVTGAEPPAPHVSPYLAPARLVDARGLAPAFIEVGELDIFRGESIDYARRLWAAGISCELSVVRGAPHAHDLIELGLDPATAAFDHRLRVIASI